MMLIGSATTLHAATLIDMSTEHCCGKVVYIRKRMICSHHVLVPVVLPNEIDEL